MTEVNLPEDDERLFLKLPTLTSRETEVLTLIGHGLTHAEIAARLGRSRRTIESHRLSIGRKLQVRKQVDLARIAISAGLVPLATGRRGPSAPVTDGLRKEIARTKHAQAALRRVEEATSTSAGMPYLEALAAALCDALSVRSAAVIAAADDESSGAEVVAGRLDGEPMETIQVDVASAPWCRETPMRSSFVRDLAREYPDDALVRHTGASNAIACSLSDLDGTVIGSLCVLHDAPINEQLEPELILRVFAGRTEAELNRLRAERLLRESEARYRFLADHTADLICRLQPDATIRYASPASERVLGLPAERLVGRSHYELVYPDDRARFADLHARLERDGGIERIRLRYRHVGGGFRWLEADFRAVESSDGDGIAEILGSLRDVSEQQAAAEAIHNAKRDLEHRVAERTAALSATVEALSEAEERWRSLVDNAGDVIMILDREHRIRFVNGAQVHTTRKDLVGADVSEILPGGERARYTAAINGVFSSGRPAMLDHVTLVGDAMESWSVQCSPIFMNGSVSAVTTVSRNVTEQRRAESRVHELEERWRSVLQGASDYIVVVDREGRIEFVNKVLPEHTYEEILGSSVIDHTAEPDRDRMRQAIERVFETGEPVSGTYSSDNGFGVRFWESRISPVHLDGTVVCASIIASDITERTLREQTLRQSEERYRQLVDLAPDGILVHDGHQVLFANRALARLLGAASPEEMVGLPVLDRVVPEDRESVRQRVAAVLAGHDMFEASQRRLVRFDGQLVHAQVTGRSCLYDGVKAIQVVIRAIDVTPPDAEVRGDGEAAAIAPRANEHASGPGLDRTNGHHPHG